MGRALPILRILLEVAAAATIGYFVLFLGMFVSITFGTAGLLRWLAPLAGTVPAAFLARRWAPAGRAGRRRLLDLWLATGALALVATAGLVEVGWPLLGPHREGFMIGGRSENLLLLTWIHLGFYAAALLLAARIRTGGDLR